MNYVIVITESFESNFKKLFKKYHSLHDDLAVLTKELYANPNLGDDLGNNTQKVRMAIVSKNKGKSGGARVITFNDLAPYIVRTCPALNSGLTGLTVCYVVVRFGKDIKLYC